MAKPSVKDISIIIDKCKELKDRKCEFKEKKFLTPIQQEIFKAGTDISLYIWKLSKRSPKDVQEHFHNHNIPIYYTEKKNGRFIVVDKEVILYQETKNGKSKFRKRLEVDEELLVLVLKDKVQKERQKYWSDNIEPLVKELDKFLFPYWAYLKMNSSFGADEQKRIEAEIKSQEPSDLDQLIHEFEKIKHKMEVEAEQRVHEKPAETEGNTTPAKRGMFKRITVWIFKKTWHLIVAIIVAIIGSFIAAILIRYFW